MPIRTCVGCRLKGSPQDFIRLARDANGGVGFWKGSGRSAYVCAKRQCVEAALKKAGLERALKTSISDNAKEMLRERLEKLLR